MRFISEEIYELIVCRLNRWSDYAAAAGLFLAPPPVTGADDHHRDVLESQRPPLWLTDPLIVGRIPFFLKSRISSSCCLLLVLQFVCLRRRLNDYFFNPILFLLDSLIKHSIYVLYGLPRGPSLFSALSSLSSLVFLGILVFSVFFV